MHLHFPTTPNRNPSTLALPAVLSIRLTAALLLTTSCSVDASQDISAKIATANGLADTPSANDLRERGVVRVVGMLRQCSEDNKGVAPSIGIGTAVRVAPHDIGVDGDRCAWFLTAGHVLEHDAEFFAVPAEVDATKEIKTKGVCTQTSGKADQYEVDIRKVPKKTRQKRKVAYIDNAHYEIVPEDLGDIAVFAICGDTMRVFESYQPQTLRALQRQDAPTPACRQEEIDRTTVYGMGTTKCYTTVTSEGSDFIVKKYDLLPNTLRQANQLLLSTPASRASFFLLDREQSRPVSMLWSQNGDKWTPHQTAPLFLSTHPYAISKPVYSYLFSPAGMICGGDSGAGAYVSGALVGIVAGTTRWLRFDPRAYNSRALDRFGNLGEEQARQLRLPVKVTALATPQIDGGKRAASAIVSRLEATGQ